MQVRQLSGAEASDPHLLPPELRISGFPFLDPDWCWIVEDRGQPIALVISSFAHGMVIFWRLLATARARNVSLNWFLIAIPQILDTVSQRGCVGYLTMLEDAHISETKIARIVQKYGGHLVPWSGSLGMGAIRKE